MPRDFSVTNTSVEEVHEIICDEAVRIGNGLASADTRIPKKWRGPVFHNASPYNDGGLTLEIEPEYHGATAKTKAIYHEIGIQSIRQAIMSHGELFAGLILGEARAGRNYFDRFGEQAPTTLF